MNLDLSDAEAPALISLLKHAIADDRYPLSERVQTWQGILDKLESRRLAHSPRRHPGSTRRQQRADGAPAAGETLGPFFVKEHDARSLQDRVKERRLDACGKVKSP